MRNTIELTVGALIATIAVSVIAAVFLLDSFLGPIFRDDLYCRVGLGTEAHNSAKAKKSDGTPLPEIEWSMCQHGTMWDGMTGRSSRTGAQAPSGEGWKIERIQ